jgi:hypothetical protein
MPDQNKLKKLNEIGYQIRPTCGICRFAEFKDKSDWGACFYEGHTYQHEKHVGAPRRLSIHRSGYCPSFEGKPEINADLAKSGFLDFT